MKASGSPCTVDINAGSGTGSGLVAWYFSPCLDSANRMLREANHINDAYEFDSAFRRSHLCSFLMTSSICAALEASIRVVPEPAGFPVGDIATFALWSILQTLYSLRTYGCRPAGLVSVGHRLGQMLSKAISFISQTAKFAQLLCATTRIMTNIFSPTPGYANTAVPLLDVSGKSLNTGMACVTVVA